MFKKAFYIITLVLTFLSFESFAAAGDELKKLPVQHGGRLKPFDSYARETLELIYGRSQFKHENANGKKEPAHLIVMSMILSPESWSQVRIFELNNLEIKSKLGLKDDQKYYRIDEVFNSPHFNSLMQDLANKRETKEKLDPYYQAVQRLENQLYTFNEIALGAHTKLIPAAEGDAWVALKDIPAKYQDLFISISKVFAKYVGSFSDKEEMKISAQQLDRAVLAFKKEAFSEFGPEYGDAGRLSSEVFYNKVHFFRWAYIFYLLGALILLYTWIKKTSQTVQSKSMNVVWALTWLGFIVQTIGFGFRVYLAERPPVTNMYETVVWVSWGAILFAMILEKIYKFRFILFAGLLTGVVSMVVADMAPAILDPSLQPLEAVLRSSYWLIIHVMTITISYSAFFLAFFLGDVGLVYYFLDEHKHKEAIRNIVTAIYRSIQIGVAFLTPGIILGGIWADYSWGRFWGWDPKETWALIALLGYIIILHARLVNWLQNFGMIVSAILAFNLVIMAWYGVNFILGAGLHSYGFGAGGIEYVSIFVAVHLLFVLFVYVTKRQQKAK